MANEMTDISSTEKMSLCLRYIDRESQELKDDFIGILDILDKEYLTSK